MAELAQLQAEIAELRAERDQSESVFSQLERQFREQQEDVSSVRSDRDRLAQSNRLLGTAQEHAAVRSIQEWPQHSCRFIPAHTRPACAESHLDAARKDAAESQTRCDEARAAAHRLELAARSLQEERDSAMAGTDLKQREVDRLAGALVYEVLHMRYVVFRWVILVPRR